MIPISDHMPTPRPPIGNYLLISINISLFLWELKLEAAGELSNFIYSWGIVPARISAVLADMSSGNPATWVALLILSSSLLIGIFLHSSFAQILSNLIFLWVFGKSVESRLGHRQFLGFYLVCGMLTGVGQILVEPTLTAPLIGANGAIAGVLGAYFVSFPKVKIDSVLPLAIVFVPVQLPALFYLFWWFVQQAFYGIGILNIPGGLNLNSIAYWAHGIGMAIGGVIMLTTRGFRHDLQPSKRSRFER